MSTNLVLEDPVIVDVKYRAYEDGDGDEFLVFVAAVLVVVCLCLGFVKHALSLATIVGIICWVGRKSFVFKEATEGFDFLKKEFRKEINSAGKVEVAFRVPFSSISDMTLETGRTMDDEYAVNYYYIKISSSEGEFDVRNAFFPEISRYDRDEMEALRQHLLKRIRA